MKNIFRLLLLLVMIGSSIRGQDTKNKVIKKIKDPRPKNAVESILETFDKYPVVALAEAHRLQQEHDLITSLIQHPAFPASVNDIVVEFGNALYQDILDRYIAGENIPLSEVRPVWRNTAFSPLAPWDAPIYEQFFVKVRAINQNLPPSRRLRVLAGDPPVDWTRSLQEIEAVKKQNPRDEHFARVVEKEVFAKGRKALIIIGGAHVYRHSWNPYCGDEPGSVIELLDQQHPKAVFVVMVHAFLTRNADLEARLASWPKPAFALIKDTWLGAIDTDLFMASTRTEGFGDGKVVTVKINKYLGMTLEDLADAYLFLGDLESLTASYPTPEMFKADPDYVREIQRRYELMFRGKKFPIESLFQERKSNKFYTPPGKTPPTR